MDIHPIMTVQINKGDIHDIDKITKRLKCNARKINETNEIEIWELYK